MKQNNSKLAAKFNCLKFCEFYYFPADDRPMAGLLPNNPFTERKFQLNKKAIKLECPQNYH